MIRLSKQEKEDLHNAFIFLEKSANPPFRIRVYEYMLDFYYRTIEQKSSIFLYKIKNVKV